MKRTLTLIAFLAVCCAMTVSCKNTKSAESTPEEIQAQKVALADSVLAEIDAFVEKYIDASSKSFGFRVIELTDAEKLIKPDYLLDPAEANNLVSKSQKINALAIYVIELSVRKIYDMPLEETKEAIAKLAAEVNYHFDMDASEANTPASERIKTEYEKCKKNGELANFWQFQYAAIVETSYLLAQNSDLFFSKITEEQWQGYRKRIGALYEALAKLAKYDEEVALIWEFRNKNKSFSSVEERDSVDQSVESAKRFRIANKEMYVARRNALLQ